MFADLPKEIRAERLQDIGTIVMTTKRFRAVGIYNNGAIAYMTVRDVKIIDITTSSIVYTKAFRGARPLSVLATGRGALERDPYKAVIAFLRGLPRKNLPGT